MSIKPHPNTNAKNPDVFWGVKEMLKRWGKGPGGAQKTQTNRKDKKKNQNVC